MNYLHSLVFIDIFYDDRWSWVQPGRAQQLFNSLTKAKFLYLSADTVHASPLHHVLKPSYAYLIHVSILFFFGGFNLLLCCMPASNDNIVLKLIVGTIYVTQGNSIAKSPICNLLVLKLFSFSP